ncbi:hypothetical protein WKI68_07600 [Streptomyces sp. MS1.HAVA.3]|uniref:Lipoprotein n=1 Tax=Streptomyces caledonius TaxID=3134107 RepID=A0ABU8U1I1_9ACTN
MAVVTLVTGALLSTAACGLSGGAGEAKEAERTGKVAGRSPSGPSS